MLCVVVVAVCGNVHVMASGISNDVLTMDATSEPSAGSWVAKMWAENVNFTTEMRVMDSNGNRTTISPHRFELYDPSSEDVLPWTYYSENSFIGKIVNADISGALRALEVLTGQQFLFYDDLPADEVLDFEEWKASETERLILEAKEKELAENPLIEIPFSEAWELAEEVEVRETVQQETKYAINWETESVEAHTVDVTVSVEVPTGKTVKKLKEGIAFDETTGKCFRLRTIDDVTIDPASLPVIDLPAYVKERMPSQ